MIDPKFIQYHSRKVSGASEHQKTWKTINPNKENNYKLKNSKINIVNTHILKNEFRKQYAHKLQKNRLIFPVLLVIQTSKSVEWCFLFGKNGSWALGPGPLAHAVGPRLWARFRKTLANTTRCYCHKQFLVLLLFFAWWCLLQCYLCLCCLVCVVSYRL